MTSAVELLVHERIVEQLDERLKKINDALLGLVKRIQKNRRMWPLIGVGSLISFVLSFIEIKHCTFLLIGQIGQSKDEFLGIGLFSTSIYDNDGEMLGCVSYYGTERFDGAFRAARAFAMMTVIATTSGFALVNCAMLFLKTRTAIWSMCQILFFFGLIAQLLTFLAFGRDFCNSNLTTCTPGAASYVGIINLFILCLLSIIIYIVPYPRHPLFALARRKEGDTEGNAEGSLSEEYSRLSSDKSMTSGSSAGDGTRESSEISLSAYLEQTKPYEFEEHAFIETIKITYIKIGKTQICRILMSLALCVSWIFAIVGVTKCTFLLVGVVGQNKEGYSGLGLFNRAYYRNDELLGCIDYPDDAVNEFDSAFAVARVFGGLTAFLVTKSLILYAILHLFTDYQKNLLWRTIQILMSCAAISHMLVFSAFHTRTCTAPNMVECVPGVAGIVSILNVFLLIPIAVFIFAMPPPVDPLFKLNQHLNIELPFKREIRGLRERSNRNTAVNDGRKRSGNIQKHNKPVPRQNEKPVQSSSNRRQHYEWSSLESSESSKIPPGRIQQLSGNCNVLHMDDQNSTSTYELSVTMQPNHIIHLEDLDSVYEEGNQVIQLTHVIEGQVIGPKEKLQEIINTNPSRLVANLEDSPTMIQASMGNSSSVEGSARDSSSTSHFMSQVTSNDDSTFYSHMLRNSSQNDTATLASLLENPTFLGDGNTATGSFSGDETTEVATFTDLGTYTDAGTLATDLRDLPEADWKS